MGVKIQQSKHNPLLATQSGSVTSKGDGYLRRIVTFYAVGLLLLVVALVFWYATHLLLIVFASILIAIMFNHTSCRVGVWLRISYPKALVLVVLTAAALLALTGVVLGPRIVD